MRDPGAVDLIEAALDDLATQPAVYNEDDHFDFDKPDNHLVAAVESGASWGYFDFRRIRERFENGFRSTERSRRRGNARSSGC